MCGRTRCSLAPRQVCEALQSRYDLTCTTTLAGFGERRENIGPGTPVPVVVAADGQERGDGDAASQCEVHSMRWGLVPSFTSSSASPDFFRMFNARSETVLEKPVFSRLMKSGRCLVVVEGFYEWKAEMKVKQPYYVHLKDQVMVFAGLWDSCKRPDGDMETCTILTTAASKRLAWLHDRMPLLLRTAEACRAWLSGQNKLAVQVLSSTAPYNKPDLLWHPVTTKMSKVEYQDNDCSKPEKRTSIGTLFKLAATQVSGGAKPASIPGPACSNTSANSSGDGTTPVCQDLKPDSTVVKATYKVEPKLSQAAEPGAECAGQFVLDKRDDAQTKRNSQSPKHPAVAKKPRTRERGAGQMGIHGFFKPSC